MEECMICFDLIEEPDFIVFSCNHKVCCQCYPKLTHCPLCDIELVNIEIVINSELVSEIVLNSEIVHPCYKILCLLSLTVGIFYALTLKTCCKLHF